MNRAGGATELPLAAAILRFMHPCRRFHEFDKIPFSLQRWCFRPEVPVTGRSTIPLPLSASLEEIERRAWVDGNPATRLFETAWELAVAEATSLCVEAVSSQLCWHEGNTIDVDAVLEAIDGCRYSSLCSW